eukprot:746938-Hanusia_phi.AAC.4
MTRDQIRQSGAATALSGGCQALKANFKPAWPGSCSCCTTAAGTVGHMGRLGPSGGSAATALSVLPQTGL